MLVGGTESGEVVLAEGVSGAVRLVRSNRRPPARRCRVRATWLTRDGARADRSAVRPKASRRPGEEHPELPQSGRRDHRVAIRYDAVSRWPVMGAFIRRS